MWGDNSFTNSTGAAGGGGGFIPGRVDSPAGGDKQKGRRVQNVFPVSAKQLLTCNDETFKIEGFEANVVTLVGLVRSVEQSATKMSMYIEDQTGTIECVIYSGSDESGGGSQANLLTESTYGRIFGAFRTSKSNKYVLAFKTEAVSDLNEVTCHLLEVVQAGIKLKKIREAEESGVTVGEGLDNTFSNSMIKGGFSGASATGAGTLGGGIQGFTRNQNLVRGIIATARDEAGMHKKDIIAAVQNKVSLKEIGEILEFLSNEGHVFSTVDDDHYKVTDSQYV